jgi:two-component system chemotaxis response regulator CheB
MARRDWRSADGHARRRTVGLRAIKRCGGVAVVQDARDAAYFRMPMTALNNVNVDFCVFVAEMGALLTRLVHHPSRTLFSIEQSVAQSCVAGKARSGS